ncbi:MAG: DUF6583 family protein [Acetivibrionales bacterium]|nr:hypothetical protein [Bacillota bacterium]
MSSRTKKLILIITVAIIIAAVVYTAWSVLTRKSTEELYLDAEKKLFGEMADNIGKQYASLKEKYKPYMEEAYSTRTELSLKIAGGLESFGFDDSGAVTGILDKSKLIVKTKTHPVKGISITEADLLLERAPFLNARLFSDPQTIWLSVPDFLPDRYFSVKRDDLEGLYDKFSIPVKPLKLISGRELAANLSFELSTFRNSAEKLADIYSGYLQGGAVADNGQKTINFGGGMAGGREVLVRLDEENATSLLRELLTAIANDDGLLLYTYGNFASISGLLDDAGLFRLFGFMDETGAMVLSDYEREILKKLNTGGDMEEFRGNLLKAAASYRLRDGIKMSVLLDKSGNIVYREVSLDFLNTEGGASFRTDIAMGNGTAGYKHVGIAFREYDPGSAEEIRRTTELSIRSAVEESESSQKEGRIDIDYAITEGSERSEIDIGIDISDRTDEKTLKRLSNIKLEADISGDVGEGNIIAVIDNASWSNRKLNKSNRTTEITLDADLPFLGISGFSATMSIAVEDSFGIEDFSLPDPDESAVMDLYTASGEDLDKLEKDIMASFGSFYLNNKYIFDALLGW